LRSLQSDRFCSDAFTDSWSQVPSAVKVKFQKRETRIMNDLRHPDIEIYIRNCTREQLEHWLAARSSGMTKLFSQGLVHEYRSVINGTRIPVLVHEKVKGVEWSSIWFKSSRTPWCRDLDCALEAGKTLEAQVRCLTSDWVRGRGARRWWSIDNGQMQEIQWF
jgi:hypothetical protein